MQELVVLGSSSSIVTPPNPSSSPDNRPRHLHRSPKSKAKPSQHDILSSPKLPTSTCRWRSPHLSTPVRWDHPARQNSLLTHYAGLAGKLAEDGRLQDFAMVAESVIASGIEASHFVAALNLAAVAKGFSRSLREGNVGCVVEVLKKLEMLGVPSLKLFDGVALELLKKECLRLVNSGEVEETVDLIETLAGFCFSIKELVDPSEIIKICVDKRKPKLALRLACILPRERILFCTIIDEFGKKGDLDSALAAYEASKDSMNVPNMYVYRMIIDVCGRCGDYGKSRYIYEDMINQKVTPNIYVFNSLMNVNAHDLGYNLQIYKTMHKLGITADVASYNILLKACCLAGRVDLAQDIYKEVKQLESTGELKLDVFTYCTIIKVFSDAKLWKMALKIKEDMLSSGVTPNSFTWSSLISACANSGLVEQAIQLFEEMILAGCEPNSQCCNILLHACVEACQYDRAFRLFESWRGSEARDPHGEHYNSNKDCVLAEHRTRQHIDSLPNFASDSHHLNFIRRFPFTPDSTTYNILMKACGSDYRRAKAIIDEMEKAGLSPNQISWTILIDICGSSGNVEGALQTLKNMHLCGFEPDVVAYTTAIKVCVENKRPHLAFSLFAEMKRYQIKPNLVTYNTLLRARTSYGSLLEVQQSLSIYQDMRKAGYKSNDYYLNQLIEEWCEEVIQDHYRKKDESTSYKGTDLGRPHDLLLEKVAAHLQGSNAESLAIDLQGLTKVEARIVVLAVLRMVKENYILGHSVKDDMWITLGVNNIDVHPDKHASEVKNAILGLLRNELGLEVLITVPRLTVDKERGYGNPHNADLDLAESLGRSRKMITSTRRPVGLQRLKVTRKSLNCWLQRRLRTTRH